MKKKYNAYIIYFVLSSLAFICVPFYAHSATIDIDNEDTSLLSKQKIRKKRNEKVQSRNTNRDNNSSGFTITIPHQITPASSQYNQTTIRHNSFYNVLKNTGKEFLYENSDNEYLQNTLFAYSSAKRLYNESNELLNYLVTDLLLSLDFDHLVYSEPILIQQLINTPDSLASFWKNKNSNSYLYPYQTYAYAHRQQKRVNTSPYLIQTAQATTGSQYYEEFELTPLEQLFLKLFQIKTLFYIFAFIIFHSILKSFFNLMKA